MDDPTLPIPDEQVALKMETRHLLEQSPEKGMALLVEGKWIAVPLWDQWKAVLKASGMRKKQFLEIVVDYRNELRLWVMGERPWEHCIAGLAGRVTRRLAPSGSAERERSKKKTKAPKKQKK